VKVFPRKKEKSVAEVAASCQPAAGELLSIFISSRNGISGRK